MDAHRIRRFARHLSLPEVGFSGQVAISRADVIFFSAGQESQLALETAQEYLLAAGVRSVIPQTGEATEAETTVVMGDSNRARAWAHERSIPLVLLEYSESSVRIVSSRPPHTEAPRELVLPGPRLQAGNIAIGGLVAAEILWQIVGGSRPT
jgi:hypothetical protein